MSSTGMERPQKYAKRIALAQDPIVTLSQNGYGICYTRFIGLYICFVFRFFEVVTYLVEI